MGIIIISSDALLMREKRKLGYKPYNEKINYKYVSALTKVM